MEERRNNVRWLIGAITSSLMKGGGEGVRDVLVRLAEQPLADSDFVLPQPVRLPVLRHLPAAIGETMMFDAGIAAAIAAVEETLAWRQSDSYTDEILGAGFSDNYGWAEIIGPHGFFPGDDFLLGLLILGPERHYKDHYHPAPELYWPLTGETDWRKGEQSFAVQPAGAAIWHPSGIVHATKTHEKPLLAVWSWTQDTHTRARLVA